MIFDFIESCKGENMRWLYMWKSKRKEEINVKQGLNWRKLTFAFLNLWYMKIGYTWTWLREKRCFKRLYIVSYFWLHKERTYRLFFPFFWRCFLRFWTSQGQGRDWRFKGHINWLYLILSFVLLLYIIMNLSITLYLDLILIFMM